MPPSPLDRAAIGLRYERVRARTQALAAPLSSEDAMVQSMPDASPAKWHLAHTTWFFEEFVLARFEPGHRWPEPRWRALFNSYYDAAGPRHARAARGVLSRPSLGEVLAWREGVDARVRALLATAPPEALSVALLGTHHEEQHQELLLTDIHHAFAANELQPAYAPGPTVPPGTTAPPAAGALPSSWRHYDEQVAFLGHGGEGFAFDNETPRHKAIVAPFAIASRPITNAEYAAFVDDGGYERPELWLADGWAAGRAGAWRGPLYWCEAPGGETGAEFTLRGLRAIDGDAPVAHVSAYEADAYARWAGARLPTEAEWEVAAADEPVEGNFLETGLLAPAAAHGRRGQWFGDVWEWTASAYLAYPGFRPLPGALGEYNGKFMSGQIVLRGGSCLSPSGHLRATYRNFFPPATRWQMSGFRLARDR